MVMQSNQTDRTNKIKKILIAFNSIHKFPMALIKCGTYAFLTVFTIGCILVMLNNTVLPYSTFSDMASKEIVRTSFILLAEAVIGGLIMDFVSKK